MSLQSQDKNGERKISHLRNGSKGHWEGNIKDIRSFNKIIIEHLLRVRPWGLERSFPFQGGV